MNRALGISKTLHCQRVTTGIIRPARISMFIGLSLATSRHIQPLDGSLKNTPLDLTISLPSAPFNNTAIPTSVCYETVKPRPEIKEVTSYE